MLACSAFIALSNVLFVAMATRVIFLKSFLFQSCNIRVAHEFDATDLLYQFTKGVEKWPKCV